MELNGNFISNHQTASLTKLLFISKHETVRASIAQDYRIQLEMFSQSRVGF